jgi:hypothetical protein
MIALGWWWLGSHPTLHPSPLLIPLTTTVSPETPTVDGREASSSNWALIDGVARTPDDDSSSEAAPDSLSSADHDSSGSWFHSCRKADVETTKRKADALAEEFEEMRNEGRHSAFIAVH